jgi:hypothetical protein
VYRMEHAKGWQTVAMEEMELRDIENLKSIFGGEITSRKFGYEKFDADRPYDEFVEVNRGTFENHAAALSKRIRQVMCLTRAVHRGRVRRGQRQ